MAKKPIEAQESSVQRPQPPQGYQDVSTDVPFYDPAVCADQPCHIDIVDIQVMPAKKGLDRDGNPYPPWHVIRGVLLEGCDARERDGNIVALNPGDEIKVSITEGLKDVARLVLDNRDKLIRVWLLPKAKIKMANGLYFWNWQKCFGPVVDRQQPLLPDTRVVRALGSGPPVMGIPEAPISSPAVN